MQDEFIPVDMRLHKGLLIVNNLRSIKLFDFATMTLLDNLGLELGCSAIQLMKINQSLDEVCLARKLLNRLELLTFKLDLGNKKIH